MRLRVLALAIAASLSSTAQAQAVSESRPASEGAIPLNYVASNGWIGASVDDNGDLSGEARGFFGDNGERLWFVEGWLGQAGAGGVSVGYHWLWGGKTRQDTIDQPDSVTVAKAFVALDQNAFDDRKLAVGLGIEKEAWFGSVYLQGGVTGERLVDSDLVTVTNLLTGTDAGRPFQQTETIATLTETFERAYDEGIGARIGRFYEPALLRFQGGLDFERGDFDSDQTTVSFGVEKFFNNSRHSLALDAEFLDKNGDFETESSDTRAMLTWRYELGKRHNFRPREQFTQQEVKRTIEKQVPSEPIVIKNEVRMSADSFFDFDHDELTVAGKDALQAVIDAMKSDKRVGQIEITGHTCDLGPDAYNQNLSERRANTVLKFFEAQGVAASDLLARGAGETTPKYPNTRDERHRNRRVDVSFLTIEETIEQQPAKTVSETVVEWEKTPVKMPAAWIERALRNPSEHKRTVDVYRFEEVSETRTLGDRVFLNRGPVATDDAATVQRAGEVVIAVLANDVDPDGDALTISSVFPAAHGTVTQSGNSLVYRPDPGYVGTDVFNYSISDGRGGQATANVRVTVQDNPPIAVDDFVTTAMNTQVTFNALSNDSDPQNDPIRVLSSGPISGGGGTLSTITDGTMTFIPEPGFVGVITFPYTIRDSNGQTATANVTITVGAGAGNSNPIAVDDAVTGLGMIFVPVSVLLNDSDPDGDSLSVMSFTQPANGQVSESGIPGVLHYRSNAGFCGIDTFSYTISDGRGGLATATVSVNVLD